MVIAASERRVFTIAGRRPASAAISSGTATIVKSRSAKAVVEKPREKELSDEEVDEIVSGTLKSDIISGLSDSNWKTRLQAVEEFCTQLQMLDASSLPTQALVRALMKKPGLKDTNFQVLKGRLEAIKYLAENGQFSVYVYAR